MGLVVADHRHRHPRGDGGGIDRAGQRAAASAARRLPAACLAVGQAQPGRPVVGMRSHPRPQLLDRAVGGAVGRDVERQPRPAGRCAGCCRRRCRSSRRGRRCAHAAASARRRCSRPPTAPPAPRGAAPPAATGRARAGRAALPAAPVAAVGVHQPPHRDAHVTGRQPPLGRTQARRRCPLAWAGSAAPGRSSASGGRPESGRQPAAATAGCEPPFRARSRHTAAAAARPITAASVSSTTSRRRRPGICSRGGSFTLVRAWSLDPYPATIRRDIPAAARFRVWGLQ